MPQSLEATETASAYLERVRAICPPVKDAASRIEEARRLPPDIVELLRTAGMFSTPAGPST